MEVMAKHDPPEVRNHERDPSRERLVENVVETTQQPQDGVARNTQLVCVHFLGYSTFHAYGLHDRLKDCDVTWLYGPLHTAVEWTSPPKPAPVPDSVDSPNPASAQDRLDLSTSDARPLPHKPILKHRSISEFLTSDFPPTSPIFSPMDSEEEHNATEFTTNGKRPAIPHTKSDTNIIRWGHNRAFRKDSPPRVNPPGFDSKTHTASGYFPPSISSLSAQAPSAICPSISQDSNSSTGGGTSGSGGGGEKHPVQKKKHISFNTFVEQCIAIEKPKKNASGFFGPGNHNDDGLWIEGRSAYVDDDGSVPYPYM